ncbi:MAG: pyridoxamine 5'-phosphate oxidase family protein [Actinomycetota bacterium]|nr:pyridoxamine 5'-phosphate oxidase family protein [Actinomycetota bacterium]
MSSDRVPQAGSAGERLLQDMYGTTDRAEKFYREQLLDTLTPRMIEFLGRQTQMIIATADTEGHPDASVRFGEAGFVTALDDRTVTWPELRGNGVMTSLGNLAKNPWTHLMFLDAEQRIGLHLRGQSSILEAPVMAAEHPDLASQPRTGRAPNRWVIMRLESSYIHCRKHFPRTDAPVDWGTDDVRAKGGDYFGAASIASPWAPDKGGS